MEHIDSLRENFRSKQTGDSVAVRAAWSAAWTAARDSIAAQTHQYFMNTILSNPIEEFSWYLFKSSVDGLSRKEASMLLSKLVCFSDRARYTEIAAALNKAKVGDILKKHHFSSWEAKRIDLQRLNSGMVLIDFCSVYYSESRKFHELLKDLYSRYRPLGLEIVSVCLEFNPNPDPENLKVENLPWVVAFAHGIEKERIEDDFGITIFPDNVLIDSTNKVILRNASFSEIEKFLREKYK
ncbi:TlpA family protein disulfide reductase [Dyadobacter sp. 32]|uniref:TlpA family protein disulfide reductase n=1 Tax=Dyadobacter sp. 32 TaxID=538966 RepID=UPI0039C69881